MFKSILASALVSLVASAPVPHVDYFQADSWVYFGEMSFENELMLQHPKQLQFVGCLQEDGTLATDMYKDLTANLSTAVHYSIYPILTVARCDNEIKASLPYQSYDPAQVVHINVGLFEDGSWTIKDKVEYQKVLNDAYDNQKVVVIHFRPASLPDHR